MSSLKINDTYQVGEDDMVITRLFERVTSKSRKVNLKPVKEVDLDNVPPPRKELHQNRYGCCELGNKKMFMKILSPGFYERSRKWHHILEPYVKNVYIKSYFDDERLIITQPKMKYCMTEVKLEGVHLDNNIQKIKDFLDRINKCKNESTLYTFSRMDIHRENFMIDEKKENFYMIDFDPWAKINPEGSWDRIIKELKK
tara:strand:- start:6 stop:602 length:597 start_codon:yes stop_codon:yes gene_type:complete